MTPEEIAALPYRRNVGIMLVNDANLVFAAQRIDTPGPAWQMPQGGIDPDEDPRTAALRELEEETGILRELVRIEAESEGWIRYDLPVEVVPKFWGGHYRGQEQKWFLMRYLGRDDQIRIDTAHPEFSTWTWMSADDLPDRIVPFKRAVYEQVIALFRPVLD